MMVNSPASTDRVRALMRESSLFVLGMAFQQRAILSLSLSHRRGV